MSVTKVKPFGKSAASQAGNWNPEKDYCTEGLGVEGEGEVVELTFHTLTCKDRVERFIAIRLKVAIAYSVTKDKYGCEESLDPKDYATSPRVLPHDTLFQRVKVPDGLRSAGEGELHPETPGIFELWSGAQTEARKLAVGEELHFRTDKDSFLIKSFYLTKIGSFAGREGGQVMAEMSQLASGITSTKLEQDEMEGVDDDEWDDDEDED
mmetsp:Transcript_131713/g.185826  ORF Transcript_131713/g.185826 Transcript_131713/m.185826 type:complete len:209 (-) Transcript_131713:46-672(-)